MLISCSDFVAEIGNYLDGEIADEVRVQLEDHLSHCRTCTVLVDSTRKTLKIVTDTASFDLLDVVFRPIGERVMAQIRETKK